MTDVLSQEEIEALLADIVSPKAAADSDPLGLDAAAGSVIHQTQSKVFLPLSRRRSLHEAARHGAVQYELYDFRRPDKISKDQLRTLQILHEAFARVFTSTISAYMRAQVQVDLLSIEQHPYEEYMRTITSSLLNVLDAPPLAGQALLEIDLRFLFVMIDRLLGGRGEGGYKPGRDLTEIEKVLAGNIVKRALGDLSQAWESVSPLEFISVSTDTSTQFLQIVPNNDTVLLILFEIRLGNRQGAMTVCLPYQLLKPILGRLSAQRWFSHQAKKDSTLAPRVADRLRETTKAVCVARLGLTKLSVGELAGLTPGTILPLTPPPGASAEANVGRAELLVADKPKFRGRVGLRDGRLAVCIDEVLAAPLPLVSHKEAA